VISFGKNHPVIAQRIQLLVKEIFSTITGKYDFFKSSAELAPRCCWRRFAIKKMRSFPNQYVFLMFACGTGDLYDNALP